jgi:hypothetical protein
MTKRTGIVVLVLAFVLAASFAPAQSGRLTPGDIVYVGAFRLPGGSGGSNWGYSGGGATYYPGGDPRGARDGFPGSLFAFGHDWHYFVSEVSIPRPVRSRNVKRLPVARTLQQFSNIRRGVKLTGETFRYGALAYLPRQGQQKTGKLYFSFGFHMQYKRVTSHGWRELNLTAGPSSGLWYIGQESPHYTNDYMFEIPAQWADRYVGGRRLATGRYREGGLSGLGPTLYAIAPWQHGNPPPPGAVIKPIPLIKYSPHTGPHRMKGYMHCLFFTGGAWLTWKGRSAVVLVGTMPLGKCWYGYRNGTTHHDCAPRCPESLGSRGYWASRTQPQLMFFDPNDLAAVARGQKKSWQPQPYAVFSLEPFMLRPKPHPNERFLVGAMAYDRARGFLYVFERRAEDDEKSVVHVFRLR